ncbi:hypothetical protein ACHWQZ_G018067 [Mnemiopsis leidyi]
MDADQEEKAPDIEDYIASPNLLAKDGSCNACDKVVDIDCESIQCFKCKNRFHAINCSNEKLCVSATTSFKNHLLPAVNKVNAFAGRFGRFLFQCDFCITAQEKAVTLKTNDHISSLNKKFEDMKSSFSRELSEVKQLLTTSIQQTAPMNPVRNPWDDSQRCAKLRSMVVIKNDEHGSPINKAILETKCVQNKISIVNTMQLKKSKDTAVILNSKKDADALMKQLAQTSPQHSTSSVATKLPRITVVGLERNYSKSELKDMVSSQNSGIYTLVNSASDDEDKKIDVLAVVPLKNNPNLYKAIIREICIVLSSMCSTPKDILVYSKVRDVIKQSYDMSSQRKFNAFYLAPKENYDIFVDFEVTHTSELFSRVMKEFKGGRTIRAWMDIGSCCKLISCKDSSSVYKYIVNSSGDALCGINTEEKAKIIQWVQYSFRIQDKKIPIDRFAEEINNFLATKTFMVGNSITLADLAVALAIQTYLGTLHITPEIQWELSSLVRWYNLIQSSNSWTQPQIDSIAYPDYTVWGVMDVPYTPKTVYQDDYDNREFISLAAQAGLKISPKILEIVLDLIRQNIDVNAIFEIIRACQEDNDRNKKYGRGPGKTS